MCGRVSIITHTRHGWVVLVMSSPNNDPSHLWFIHSFNQSIIHITSATLFGWWGARGLDGWQVAGGGAGLVPLYLLGRPA
jgi:hypothetical protein